MKKSDSHPECRRASLDLSTNNTVEAKQRLQTAVRDFAAMNRVPEAVTQAVDLALEEHLTNVWQYAFDDPGSREVFVRLTLSPGSLVVEVKDDGREFNPMAAPQVDTRLPLETKPIGGLGIHLIRSFMDDLHYSRSRGKNIFRMTKRWTSTA